MLEIKNLTKKYDEIIIDNLSINFPSTGMIVIVGASGCGKTTLLNIIGGIDGDYQGEILLDHQNIREIKKYCRKHIGFIFQNFNLINWLNVKENYWLPKFFTRVLHKRAVEDQEEKLDLKKYNKKKIKVFSGGQKQRVALLRAMVKNVDILLCDEPTGALDEENAKTVFEILQTEAKERLVIVITHNEQLAYQYGDQFFSMQQGKLIGKHCRNKKELFYSRLNERTSPLKLYKLALLQYRANFIRNSRISLGIMIALICIMITFTLSGSLQTQIEKQLNNIFPNQLVSLQNRYKSPITYQELRSLNNFESSTYIYGEPRDYEFMGISLQAEYDMTKTVYISDMTKTIKTSQLSMGRAINSNNEIILSKTTAVHLNQDYQELLGQTVYGYYLKDDNLKRVVLKVVGISDEVTALDTVYINEFANFQHISKAFEIELEQIDCQLAMINISNQENVQEVLKKLEKQYPHINFKVAGVDISNRINSFLLQIQRVLILFSSLAIVAACFLIGEVLYLSVVEKTKDIGIFKCLGASKMQIMGLVLLESFTLISVAFIASYLFFNQVIDLINQIVRDGLQIDLSESFIQVDYQLLLIIYLGALIFGLLSSYFPAFFAGCLEPVKALKHQSY